MGNYGIMRAEKRGRQALYGLWLENNRTPETGKDHEFVNSDIDWERTDQNEWLVRSDNWWADIKEQIDQTGAKLRKDSVVAIDAFYGLSGDVAKDWTHEQIEAYFKDCLAYHERTYGKAINAVIHYDEATPHMHVLSVPLVQTEDRVRLSAKILMGGRGDYVKRQDLFYDQVCKDRGLDRGESAAETKRQHKTALDHKVEQAEKDLQAVNSQIDSKKANLGQISAFTGQVKELAPKLQNAIDRAKDDAIYSDGVPVPLERLPAVQGKPGNAFKREVKEQPERVVLRADTFDQVISDLEAFQAAERADDIGDDLIRAIGNLNSNAYVLANEAVQAAEADRRNNAALEALKAQNANLQAELTESLESMVQMSQAAATLLYSKGKYKADLTRDQEGLVNGIRTYAGQQIAQHDKELAREATDKFGISAEIAGEIEKAVPQRQQKSRGWER